MSRSTNSGRVARLRHAASSLICTLALILAALGLTSCVLPDKHEPLQLPLRLGTSFDYHPFSTRASGGEAAGFDIAIGRAFAASRGAFEWVPFAWPTLQRDFAARNFEIAMSGVTVRPERSLTGRFSLPVAVSGAIAIVREVGATSAADLNRAGVVIAVNAGGHLERVTRREFPAAKITAIPDNARVISELLEGRAQAAITDTHEAASWMGTNTGLTTIGPFTRDYKAYWVQPGREDLARELDTWLLARERDQTLDRLRRQFFGDGEWRRTALPAAALQAAVAERRALMPHVAEAKRESGGAIEDPAREAVVVAAGIASVARAATERGVAPPDEAVVRAFFVNEIEEAKRIQRETLAAPRAAGARVYDLRGELRPALLRIGDKIAMLLVERSIEDSSRTNEL